MLRNKYLNGVLLLLMAVSFNANAGEWFDDKRDEFYLWLGGTGYLGVVIADTVKSKAILCGLGDRASKANRACKDTNTSKDYKDGLDKVISYGGKAGKVGMDKSFSDPEVKNELEDTKISGKKPKSVVKKAAGVVKQGWNKFKAMRK